MAKRKTISKKTRFEVFKRDSFICQYCGRSAPDVILHLDHVQPISKDGDNDIFNLITSCEECNAGKSNRLLSDNAAIHKQKAQLDQLNERREQLEMLIQWRTGLRDIGDMEVDAFADAWADTATGYALNESGRLEAKKLITKYGISLCLDAIQRSIAYLETDEQGKVTEESVAEAFRKIRGILKTLSYPEWKQKLIHIRNTAKMGKGWHPSTAAMLLDQFERLYHLGDDLDALMKIARERFDFNMLWEVLEARIEDLENDG